MSKDSLEDIWERVRARLRYLRGRNRFRGSEVHIIPRREVRIPVENRGGTLQEESFVIHLSDAESDVWAEKLPEGEKFHIRDFNLDLDALVDFVVDRCRGADYLHTNRAKADYRKREKGEEDGKG